MKLAILIDKDYKEQALRITSQASLATFVSKVIEFKKIYIWNDFYI